MAAAAGGNTYWNNIGSGQVYFTYDGITSNTLSCAASSIIDRVQISVASFSASKSGNEYATPSVTCNVTVANGGTASGFTVTGAKNGSIDYTIYLDVYAHFKSDSGSSASHFIGTACIECEFMSGDSFTIVPSDFTSTSQSIFSTYFLDFTINGTAL